MQIRYQFIGDLDTIIIDKTLGGPNLPMSSLYGMSLLLLCACFQVVHNILHSVSLLCCCCLDAVAGDVLVLLNNSFNLD